LRRGRDEAAACVEKARFEADELRAQARAAIDEARGEVHALNRSRDEISAELAQLSGVIEALAITENDNPPAPAGTPSEPAGGAGSEHEEEDNLI
jgi:outer membrane protein TolC